MLSEPAVDLGNSAAEQDFGISALEAAFVDGVVVPFEKFFDPCMMAFAVVRAIWIGDVLKVTEGLFDVGSDFGVADSAEFAFDTSQGLQQGFLQGFGIGVMLEWRLDVVAVNLLDSIFNGDIEADDRG